METEYEKARMALDMFCHAAEKVTGDYWEIQQMENGDLAVVQTFKAAKKTINDLKIPDEEKKLVVTGMIYCTSSGGLTGLADRLAKSFKQDSLLLGELQETSWPLPFLDGCSSIEEMSVRLAACS